MFTLRRVNTVNTINILLIKHLQIMEWCQNRVTTVIAVVRYICAETLASNFTPVYWETWVFDTAL